MRLKDLAGTNALTVMLAPSQAKKKTKMFFCPYRKNIVGKYQGQVNKIIPGYDSEATPQFFAQPHRQSHEDNISYIFITQSNKSTEVTYFWIQDQYFDTQAIKQYHCYNCQAPQLYYNEDKVVDYHDKHELKTKEKYTCKNCQTSLQFLGVVKIKSADELWN